MTNRILVVGAGQAGLAIGYFLQSAKEDYVIVDASDQLGQTWADRWDSLRLFTPAKYSSLPGSPFPSADPWSYPTKDEASRYLKKYAETHQLNVRLNAAVGSVRHDGETFLVDVAGAVERFDRVVVATGPFSTPWLPAFAAALGTSVQQIHSGAYRNPTEVHGQEVLVVGGGNSGFQIALELAMAGKSVHLSERTRTRTLPQRILGRDLFWWLSKVGILSAGPNTPIGRRLRRAEPIIGISRRQLQRAGVVLHPGAVDAHAGAVSLVNGGAVHPDSVIWATGFRTDDRWIEVPDAVDTASHDVTDAYLDRVPGLFTIGRPWQRNRGSALLGFVGDDARHLSRAVTGQ